LTSGLGKNLNIVATHFGRFFGFGGQAWFEIKDGGHDFNVDEDIVSTLNRLSAINAGNKL
jgi:hypothetical protein